MGGPTGPFGPRGPFGPHGPFGPAGPFGAQAFWGGPEHRQGRGPGGRGGRARRGDVRTAILALLAEQPRNGYQIIQALEERTAGVWRPSPGAVYPALAQLGDEGLVEQVEESGQKVYRLTEAGVAAASGITEKPWEAVTESTEAWVPHAAPALWREFGQLALAARSVLATGDADLAAEAIATLEAARRRLYGLLAESPDETD